jgi:hypothetical protein
MKKFMDVLVIATGILGMFVLALFMVMSIVGITPAELLADINNLL